MQTFAIVVLIILIIGLTHLHNWAMRLLFKEDDAGMVALVVTVLYAAMMFSFFQHLILWGYPLITKT